MRRGKALPDHLFPAVPTKPTLPEITDTKPERKDLYFGTLVGRMLKDIDTRRAYAVGRHTRRVRVSMANISRLTGIPVETIRHYLTRRDRKMTIEVIDKVLWATKLSVLDLLNPSEILSHIESMDYTEREILRSSMKRLLDKIDERESNGSSAKESASQKYADLDEA